MRPQTFWINLERGRPLTSKINWSRGSVPCNSPMTDQLIDGVMPPNILAQKTSSPCSSKPSPPRQTASVGENRLSLA